MDPNLRREPPKVAPKPGEHKTYDSVLVSGAILSSFPGDHPLEKVGKPFVSVWRTCAGGYTSQSVFVERSAISFGVQFGRFSVRRT